MGTIPPELAAFLESGISVHIGTRSARLEPNGARGVAVKVGKDGRSITVYVSKKAADSILPDLEANAMVALGFGRPSDDRACQLKGTMVSVRPARADERSLVERQWDGFLNELGIIGIQREATFGWSTWPAIAIRCRVDALFNQTPGPGTGAPMP